MCFKEHTSTKPYTFKIYLCNCDASCVHLFGAGGRRGLVLVDWAGLGRGFVRGGGGAGVE